MTVTPVNEIAARIYEELSPIAYADEEHGYPLLRFLEAWTQPMVEVYNLVRDADDGAVGWSSAVDIQRATDSFLDFISQFVGVTFRGGETPEDKRALIETLLNIKRGSASSSRAWVQRYLTGQKYMIFNERQAGSAYRYAVRTKVSETPNPALVLQGLMEQKPAGLILDYSTFEGLTYDTTKAGYDTYTQSYINRATYLEWETELPGS